MTFTTMSEQILANSNAITSEQAQALVEAAMLE